MKSIRHDPYVVADPYHGIYAHGVETQSPARILQISGQVGVTDDGAVSSDFETQCRQSLQNLEAVLLSADMTLKDITKMTFFLVDRSHMVDLIAVRKALLDGVRPAITTVIVKGLVSPDWLVEVEAFACAS